MYCFQLQLLTCVTEVCLSEMMSHRIPSDNTVQLLEVALDKYIVAHRQKVVLQQVTVNCIWYFFPKRTFTPAGILSVQE